jgi:hypothetical protein
MTGHGYSRSYTSELKNDRRALVQRFIPIPQAGRPARQVWSGAWVKLALVHLMIRLLATRLE